jgi:hypothetical protein
VTRPAIQAMMIIALRKYPATVTAVAAVLIDADHRFGGDWFYLARDEIARDADISVNQVSNSIARLDKDGWVKVERHAGPSHTNRFAICWDQLMAAHEERRTKRASMKARKARSRQGSNNATPTGLPAEAPSKNLVGERPRFRTQRESPKTNKPYTPAEPFQQRKRALRSELHNSGKFKGPSSREVYEDGLNKRLMQRIRDHHRRDELLELYSRDQVLYLETAKKSVEAAFEALVLALCKAKPEPTAMPAIATTLHSTTAPVDSVSPRVSDTTLMLRQLRLKPLVNEWSRGISKGKDHNDVKS